MGFSWDTLIAVAGGAIATLLGVVAGGVFSARSQRRHWSLEKQADACARVLSESSRLLVDLARLNGQHVNPLPDQIPLVVDWKPWRDALSLINLVAPVEVAESAHRIDEEIWRAHILIKAGKTDEGGWCSVRDEIEIRQRTFTNLVRHRLVAGGALLRLTGRPTSDVRITDVAAIEQSSKARSDASNSGPPVNR